MLISGKTASSCLERLCIGTAPSADQLENESVSVDQVIEWARRRGLRAKLIPLSWEELQNLISSDPVLLALRNGNTVLALRNGASAEEIVVADPLYEDGQEFFLPRHLLEDAWGGDAITLRRVSGPRKYKVGWVVSGFGTCMAALTIGAVFSVYPAQKVVRSFAELAREDEAEIVIQINGKLRGRIYAGFGTARETLEKQALGDAKIRALLDGKQIVKIIVVPDKLVNIVVK